MSLIVIGYSTFIKFFLLKRGQIDERPHPKSLKSIILILSWCKLDILNLANALRNVSVKHFIGLYV